MNTSAVMPVALIGQNSKFFAPQSDRLKIWEQDLVQRLGFNGYYLADSTSTTTYCAASDDTQADGDY